VFGFGVGLKRFLAPRRAAPRRAVSRRDART